MARQMRAGGRPAPPQHWCPGAAAEACGWAARGGDIVCEVNFKTFKTYIKRNFVNGFISLTMISVTVFLLFMFPSHLSLTFLDCAVGSGWTFFKGCGHLEMKQARGLASGIPEKALHLGSLFPFPPIHKRSLACCMPWAWSDGFK